ncbi:MAG TPA: Asp/Glu/hydantoin racemase [Chloroflexota bacterium]|nr:Asp/Glu/hydantoin racemase [Chloroflexota bacterium]
MAKKRLVMIHTVHSLPRSFGALCDELLPGVEVEHVVDEDMLRETLQAGQLTDAVRQRFAEHARAALATRPDAVVLTCSSVGPAADGTEVHRIDAAMADRAVQLGANVGVAATVPTTLSATSDLIRRAAERAGKTVEIRTELAEGAFAALGRGETDVHDRLVRAALEKLAAWADVVVLAQASMARALAGATEVEAAGRRVPLLTSPRLGVERLRELLGA